ncbi:colicin Z C-terminal domain-related protein [Stappia stellulata]|uniref:colicin Z C-terminal domain-related protein n=1 Tax=Stappia stellulata TaxID=71235 RepID=UPI0039908F8A
MYDQIAGAPRTLRIKFNSSTETPSTFSVEIQGGNGQSFQRPGPGSTTVRLTENMATEIRMRARSHGIFAQRILVSVI